MLLSHLQLANDTIFFGYDKEESFLVLSHVLPSSNPCQALRGKCQIFGLIMSQTSGKDGLAGLVGCEIDTYPSSYLGLPLGRNQKCFTFWNSIREKVQKRLGNWKRSFFFKGGRLTLFVLF